ncbi:MAG TPA: hypothetical protein VES70_27765 [Pseudomonas sp.]|nr:hypothetical protein [Pseudomonas sp.]
MTSTTNLPAVNVHPPKGEGSTSSGFWGSALGMTNAKDFSGSLEDHEGPIEDDPGAVDQEYDDAYWHLVTNTEFLKLPLSVQNLVVSDHALTKQVSEFFKDGGKISVVDGLARQAEYDVNTKTIRIRKSILDDAEANFEDAQYAATTLIHELGHYLDKRPYNPTSRDETAEWYLHSEMLAGLYQLLHWQISRGATGVTAGDYNEGYTAMYLSYMSHGNLDQLLNEMKSQFRTHRGDQMEAWRNLYQP